MRKIVSFATPFHSENSYEDEVFSKMADVVFVKTVAKTEEEVIEAAKDAEVVLFTSTGFSEKVISQLKNCGLMVRYGIGFDTVDLEATKKRGIFVCNSPKYGVIDVAEHAISLMFAVSKHLVELHERVSNGIMENATVRAGARLCGKTIGFLGFGNIGRAVCERTNGCGMKAIVYDPYVKEETLAEYKAQKVDFDEFLKNADYISCHLPLNEQTRHCLNKEAFKKMKNTAVIINTSRGGVINEKDLAQALENGEIAGVGLDVFEDESVSLDPRLAKSQNAVLTPHIAWNTPDAIVTLRHEVTDNVVRYLNGERPESIVNGL